MFEYRGNLTTVDPGFNEYAFEFIWNSRKCWIDASNDDKSLGRLVNDDENDSNSIVKRIIVGGLPHLCFFATRTISEGEEVTFTYFQGEYDQFPWRLKEGNTDEIRPVKGNTEEERPVKGHTEEERQVEGNTGDERPVEENKKEGRQVEEKIEEERPVEGNTEEESPVEGNIEEERPVEGNTEEESPVEGNIEEERPVEGNTEEESPVEGNIEEERPVNMDITNDRSRESEHVAESDPEDLEEGVTLEAIDCLVKYEIQKSENNIHKELTEFRKQYSNNAIGELRAHLDEVKKEVNRNAQGCDTGFNDLTATVNSMETTISQIETESKGSKRKIQELEKKVTDIDRKFNDITAGIPKIIEDIITSGTLAFMPTNSFDIDESVDEPMTIMSTPVSMSTNLITEHAEGTSQKRAVDEGVKKKKYC